MFRKKYVDLTMDLNIALDKFTQKNTEPFNPKLLGHVGTHIDIMNTKGLAVDRFISKAHLIDVSNIFGREITMYDAKLDEIDIAPNESVIFNTNWSDLMLETSAYFINHPYLSCEMIDYLLHKQVNLIAIDAPGVRRGKEHHLIDEYCANHNVFIVENLVNLSAINKKNEILLYCFPLNFTKNTGVTCRVLVCESVPMSE